MVYDISIFNIFYSSLLKNIRFWVTALREGTKRHAPRGLAQFVLSLLLGRIMKETDMDTDERINDFTFLQSRARRRHHPRPRP